MPICAVLIRNIIKSRILMYMGGLVLVATGLFGCVAPEVGKPEVAHVEPVSVELETAPSVITLKDREEIEKVPLIIGIEKLVKETEKPLASQQIAEVPSLAGIEKALKGEGEPLAPEIATVPTIRLAKPREGKPYTGPLISINFQNAELIEVLDFFAEIAGLNLVVHPGVSGTVTLRLENVPWDQALDMILKMHNLRVAFVVFLNSL